MPPLALLAVSATNLVASKMTLHWRSRLFLAGMECLFLFGYLWQNVATWLCYPCLVVIVAGALLGPRASFASAPSLMATFLLFRP